MWESAAFGSSGIGQPGGGFLDTTNNFSSPSKTQDDRKRTDRITNIVPCTIAQVLQVPETEEHLKIGELSAHIITIVGCVKEIIRHSTKITYVIDDMSGKPIEAQYWIADDLSANEAEKIATQSYVRVTGQPRIARGKRHIIIFKIRCITDLNELTMHLLEVIHTSMAATIMSKQSASHSVVQAGNRSAMDVTGAASSFTGSHTVNAPSMYAAVQAASGLSKPQQMVLQAIISCTDEQGANIQNVVNELRSLNRKVIMDAVEFLSNEGHIYSTIDDHHYKSTDSG